MLLLLSCQLANILPLFSFSPAENDDGTFAEPMTYPPESGSFQTSIAAGDFSSDVKLDLVMADYLNSYAYILRTLTRHRRSLA